MNEEDDLESMRALKRSALACGMDIPDEWLPEFLPEYRLTLEQLRHLRRLAAEPDEPCTIFVASTMPRRP